MPATRSYSLPDEVVEFVDNLPKRERSKFVASTLIRAVRQQSKLKALEALNSIVPMKSDDLRGSVELLESSHQARLDELVSKTENDDK
ncbi:MAG: putative ribonuclease YlaK [Parasphingorhabdus sp.]|jgi:predicted ribonuclease YlaK